MENNNSRMDEIFREKLKHHEVRAEPYNWGFIQEQLYTDNNPYKRKKWPKYVSYAALFLLTIGLTAASSYQYFAFTISGTNDVEFDQNSHLLSYYNNLVANGLPVEIITKEVEVLKEVEVPILTEVTKIKYITKEDFSGLPEQFQYLSYSDEQLENLRQKIALLESINLDKLEGVSKEQLAAFDKKSFEKLISQNDDFIKTASSGDISSLVTNSPGMALDGSSSYNFEDAVTTEQLVDNILRKKLTNLNGFHIGASNTLLNSWILNKRSSSIPFKNVIYPLTFGYQYGATMGYSFGSKFGFEVSLLRANQGQRISQLIDFDSIDSEVRLNYMHIPFAFKYKWEQFSSITNNPIVLNYLFGLQYSKLLSMHGQFHNDIILTDDIERIEDIGFLIGLDYDIFLADNYFLTIGARSTFSSDLNAILSTIAGETNTKTNNFTVGVKASINYLLNSN